MNGRRREPPTLCAATPRPGRAVAALIAYFALASLAPAAARAQEAGATAPPPPPPAAPQATGTGPRAEGDVEGVQRGDELEVSVRNLHLVLPDRDLELRADHAILWGDSDLLELFLPKGGGERVDPLHAGPQIPTTAGRPPLRTPGRDDPAAALKEIYAEGHVLFREGSEKVVLAERLYEHLLERRGVIVDCDLYAATNYRAEKPDPRFPLTDAERRAQQLTVRLHARELRALGPDQLAAHDAQFTTCRYGLPHYHVRAGDLKLELEPDENGTPVPVAEMDDASLHWDDVPLMPLPGFRARVDEGDSLPIQRVHAGHSSRFGAFLQTQWGSRFSELSQSLTDEFGLARPLRVGWEADVDGYSRRGAGLGSAFQWKEPGAIDGEVGGYWLRDRAGRDQETPFVIDDPDRGRSWLRQRFMPADHWRLDTEASWFSDPGFEPEFFEREFKEEKAPENDAQLLRQEGTTRFSFLYKNRVNEWQSELDALPAAGFDQVGEALAAIPLPDWLQRDGQPNELVLSHFTSVGNFRDHPADSTGLPPQRVVRANTEIELSTTIPLGPADLRPFTSGEFTGWDRNARNEKNLGRAAGIAGARAELELHRNYDLWTPWLGIDGLRHAVLLEADYVNVYDVSRAPSELIPLDATEQLDEREVYLLAVRQRAQTHRGAAIVDFLDLDVELPLYPHADRDNPVVTPNGTVGRTEGPLHLELRHWPAFSASWLQNTALFAEGDWDLHDHRLSTTDLGVTMEPRRDWATLLSWRATRGLSRAATAEIDYQLTEKWAVAALEQYDFRAGRGLAHRYELRRLGHDVGVALGFERDPGSGNTSFTISLFSVFLGSRSRRGFMGGRGEAPALDPNSF